MSSTMILQVQHVFKNYQIGDHKIPVLNDINFEIEEGSTVSIVGPSGSGKTTLLGLCAGLDQSSEGDIILNGIKLTGLSEDKLAQVRNEHVGFVFQNFQLLPTLTALENVLVPMELRGMRNKQKEALELLEKVGLSARADHYPSQLSGGEQQRVSLARAFANKPKILFADEPTGNLDAETSAIIEDMLFQLNKESGTTLVIVTHDLDLAAKTQKIIPIKGGKIQ
ncbi:Lipoprotein-releasing system ATP-binding protein LolD [Sphingobacterium mizutaii]|uniref:Lipoprotein-releasing system ATP-binding protein LolD n=2 Tax=Sphingobacterium mizutaii TaxID=1010 RepID=A0AAJ4XA23_9SPHI|nr:ABC transporter ATP-binding protein [Sphingobacterium mizutaii]SDK88776.1 putative ABC transport system ATP-binding protein [Sphingobacterium mizutaii]SNV46678.1 Lipoprotein-releasing system ATP-binding protein LolD [Sphingobacterium mizutaii]